MAALVIAAGLLGGALVAYLKPEPPRPTTRLSVTLPAGDRFSYTGRRVVALSPSGSHLAYVASQMLNLRPMDTVGSTPPFHGRHRCRALQLLREWNSRLRSRPG